MTTTTWIDWRTWLAAELDRLIVEASAQGHPEAGTLLQTVLTLLRPADDKGDWRGWLRQWFALLYNMSISVGLPAAAEYVRSDRLRALHRDECHEKRGPATGKQRVRCRVVGASGRPGAVVTLELPSDDYSAL